MKKKVKIIGIILVAIVIIIIGVYSYLKPVNVDTKKAVVSEAKLTFSETGVVKKFDYKTISSNVNAKVKEVLVKKDDKVKKGDVLARLDDSKVMIQIANLEESIKALKAQKDSAKITDYTTKEQLKQQKSSLESAKINLKTTNIDELNELIIEISENKYNNATSDLEKYKVLFQEGIISEAEYKTYEERLDDYKLAFEQATSNSNKKETNYEDLSKELDLQIKYINNILVSDTYSANSRYYEANIKTSENNIRDLNNTLKDFEVKSKEDGIISEDFIKDVDLVQIGTVLFNLKTDKEETIEVKVNTRDINSVEIGEDVIVTLLQRDEDIKIKAKVIDIANEATKEISSLGIEERDVLVKLLPEKNDILKEGYEVDCDFILYQENKAITVPNSAIYKKEGKEHILVAIDGRIKERSIKLGEELNGYTVVKEGLKEEEIYLIDADDKNIRVGASIK